MIKVKNEFVDLYEELSKLNEDASTDTLATEDDWDAFCENKAPVEIDYGYLEIPVEAQGRHGSLNRYTFILDGVKGYWEGMKELVSKFLKKPVEEITKADLLGIKEDEFSGFVESEYVEKAYAEAEREWNRGNIDIYSVDWE